MDITSFLLGYKSVASKGSDLDDVNATLDAINGEIIGAKTVTYIVESEVYATVEVALGDTAKRPTNPTKASSVAEDFSFAGWSLTEGGEVDSNALKNVTEDRTVYAVFTASPRYYTVSFYDDTGTFLTSEKIVYGGSSAYTHEKTGGLFRGWNPEPVNITGDLSCYGTWVYTNFVTDSWATVKEVAQTHNAANNYALENERDITLQYADGTSETATVYIDKFNPGEELVDENNAVIGTAGMRLRIKHPLANSKMQFMPDGFQSAPGNKIGFDVSGVLAYLNDTVIPALPSDLRAVLYGAAKQYTYGSYSTAYNTTGYYKLWLLNKNEANAMTAESRIRTLRDSGRAVYWWLDEVDGYAEAYMVLDNGNIYNKSPIGDQAYVLFQFYL
jgi:hypothetical protein